MELTLALKPPAGWRGLVHYPVQLEEYARATRHLGYRPYFCHKERQAALVQLRSPLPLVGRCLSRAYVYPSAEDRCFLIDIVRLLKRQGVPFVRIGNTMWGVRDAENLQIAGYRVRVVERETAVLDVTRDEAAILRGMNGAERKIRKAEKEKVEVSEASTLADIHEYHALSKATADRIRQRSLFTELPRAFFVDVYEHMIKNGAAKLFLARANGTLIAGNLFFIHGDTMFYYQGASTRDRSQTFRQAPAACFWVAIKAAKSMGLTRFDLGGFTPVTDPSDSRYGVYEFKKRWGGMVERFYNAEIQLSPLMYRLQQKLIAPLWQRVHPFIWRVVAAQPGGS